MATETTFVCPYCGNDHEHLDRPPHPYCRTFAAMDSQRPTICEKCGETLVYDTQLCPNCRHPNAEHRDPDEAEVVARCKVIRDTWTPQEESMRQSMPKSHEVVGVFYAMDRSKGRRKTRTYKAMQSS